MNFLKFLINHYHKLFLFCLFLYTFLYSSTSLYSKFNFRNYECIFKIFLFNIFYNISGLQYINENEYFVKLTRQKE